MGKFSVPYCDLFLLSLSAILFVFFVCFFFVCLFFCQLHNFKRTSIKYAQKNSFFGLLFKVNAASKPRRD